MIHFSFLFVGNINCFYNFTLCTFYKLNVKLKFKKINGKERKTLTK